MIKLEVATEATEGLDGVRTASRRSPDANTVLQARCDSPQKIQISGNEQALHPSLACCAVGMPRLLVK